MLDDIIKLYGQNSSWFDFFSMNRVRPNILEVSSTICCWFSFGHKADHHSPLFKATLKVFNQQLDRVIEDVKAEEMACKSLSPNLKS